MKTVALSVSALCLSLCTPAARAGEFFVNAVTGSDANSGTSPGAPWKTLTHALGVAVASDDTIHVAPGDYSAATGEAFPLPLGVALILGDQGSAVTRIVGSGAEVLLLADTAGKLEGVRLEGLSLLNGSTGLRLVTTEDFASVLSTDLVIVGMSGYGIDLQAHGAAGVLTPPSITTFFDGLDVADCGNGVRLSSSSPTQASLLALTNSSIHDSAGDGVHVVSVAGGKIMLALSQTSVLRQGQAGVRADVSGFTQLGFGSCLIAGNGTGIDVANDGGELQVGLFFSTVAGNSGAGLQVEDGMPATADIGGSLFWGNGEDVTGGVIVAAKNSDSEHGVFGTDNGNFSADPQFRDAGSGDYHLSFGSSCIEAGDPTFTLGAVDLDGAQRPADGDLDTIERLDVGCFELNPLLVETTGELGSELLFGFIGSPCMMTSLFFAPGPAAAAHTTGFGKLRLGPAGISPLLVTIALAPAPNVVAATIPDVSALVGQTFSFQSLTQSLIAPKGAALTNVESFTVSE